MNGSADCAHHLLLRSLKHLVPQQSCASFYESGEREDGVYLIDPDGFGTFKVWCDMQDGGGWTLFQRRQDGSVDFYRGWSDYKVGFGNLTGEFWLGLDKIHRLTTSSTQSILRIDMWDFAGTHAYAEYKNFCAASESDSYKLNIGNFSGNAGDSFINLNGMMFTTNDRDNDPNRGNVSEVTIDTDDTEVNNSHL
ncbi:Hypothetical predicted protein [Paramuricea clavata]|uniref:Uncharacterized protein n=1 Tax=Paramuricea clavata TaxID=317549 RepID=A0A6S7I9S7_PARCT|nr:Hypothetical predicted protein [Paramuricea clavata]